LNVPKRLFFGYECDQKEYFTSRIGLWVSRAEEKRGIRWYFTSRIGLWVSSVGKEGTVGESSEKLNKSFTFFWSFRITKSGKIRNFTFHPIIKENAIPDYEIRKPQGHFWKQKQGARESYRVGKVILIFLSDVGLPYFINF